MHTKDILGNFLADSYAIAVGFSSILHLFKICFPINLWVVYFVLVLIVVFNGRRLQNVILFSPSKRIDDSQKRIDGNLGRDIWLCLHHFFSRHHVMPFCSFSMHVIICIKVRLFFTRHLMSAIIGNTWLFAALIFTFTTMAWWIKKCMISWTLNLPTDNVTVI